MDVCNPEPFLPGIPSAKEVPYQIPFEQGAGDDKSQKDVSGQLIH